MLKYGNFNQQYINTVFKTTEGYFDPYNYESQNDHDKKSIIDNRRKGIPKIGKNYVYEFVMIPNDSFLNENHQLPPGVELKICLDRLPAEYSVYKVRTEGEDTLKGKALELKNVYAQVEYVSSTALRHYHDSINMTPLEYNYDECSIICKSLPQGEQFIRMENLKGGNTPDYLFIGVVPTEGVNGSTNASPINFKNYGIKEINLSLNGNPCHGYPIQIQNDYPLLPYVKMLEVLGRNQNTQLPAQINMAQFAENMIFAHKFEGEDSSQGWLGVCLSIAETSGFTEAYTLVLWTVHNVKTTIDKFHMVEKYNL